MRWTCHDCGPARAFLALALIGARGAPTDPGGGWDVEVLTCEGSRLLLGCCWLRVMSMGDVIGRVTCTQVTLPVAWGLFLLCLGGVYPRCVRQGDLYSGHAAGGVGALFAPAGWCVCKVC